MSKAVGIGYLVELFRESIKVFGDLFGLEVKGCVLVFYFIYLYNLLLLLYIFLLITDGGGDRTYFADMSVFFHPTPSLILRRPRLKGLQTTSNVWESGYPIPPPGCNK